MFVITVIRYNCELLRYIFHLRPIMEQFIFVIIREFVIAVIVITEFVCMVKIIIK